MFAGAADFVVSADDARFGSPVLRAMGVNDAEFPSFLLRVPEMTAKRVIWLGEYLDAAEARQAGFSLDPRASSRSLAP